MDGLTAIRIEKTKADDLLALARNPKRTGEALQKLMAETNNDFHYFNRLRAEKIANGTYVPIKTAANAFKDAGGLKNRVKKAIKKPYEDTNNSAMLMMSGMSKTKTKKVASTVATADAPCVWRGKSSDGEWLHCTNLRLRHPTLKSDDGEPLILKQCSYHSPTW